MPLFSKTAKKSTRLFYATDLHGSERTYRKFLNAGKFYDAQVLVMGGDIIGKLAVPILREGNGHYRATLQGNTEHIDSEDGLKALVERLGLLGFYHKVMTEDEFRALAADRAAVDALFHTLARQRAGAMRPAVEPDVTASLG
jgi:Icc-related predicted phosphoesterase